MNGQERRYRGGPVVRDYSTVAIPKGVAGSDNASEMQKVSEEIADRALSNFDAIKRELVGVRRPITKSVLEHAIKNQIFRATKNGHEAIQMNDAQIDELLRKFNEDDTEPGN